MYVLPGVFVYMCVVANVTKPTQHKVNKIHPASSSDEDTDDNDDSQLHVCNVLFCEQ